MPSWNSGPLLECREKQEKNPSSSCAFSTDRPLLRCKKGAPLFFLSLSVVSAHPYSSRSQVSSCSTSSLSRPSLSALSWHFRLELLLLSKSISATVNRMPSGRTGAAAIEGKSSSRTSPMRLLRSRQSSFPFSLSCCSSSSCPSSSEMETTTRHSAPASSSSSVFSMNGKHDPHLLPSRHPATHQRGLARGRHRRRLPFPLLLAIFVSVKAFSSLVSSAPSGPCVSFISFVSASPPPHSPSDKKKKKRNGDSQAPSEGGRPSSRLPPPGAGGGGGGRWKRGSHLQIYPQYEDGSQRVRSPSPSLLRPTSPTPPSRHRIPSERYKRRSSFLPVASPLLKKKYTATADTYHKKRDGDSSEEKDGSSSGGLYGGGGVGERGAEGSGGLGTGGGLVAGGGGGMGDGGGGGAGLGGGGGGGVSSSLTQLPFADPHQNPQLFLQQQQLLHQQYQQSQELQFPKPKPGEWLNGFLSWVATSTGVEDGEDDDFDFPGTADKPTRLCTSFAKTCLSSWGCSG